MKRLAPWLLIVALIFPAILWAQPVSQPPVRVVLSATEPTSCRPGDIWIDTSSGVPANYEVNIAADCTTGAIVYVSAGAAGAGGGEAITIGELPATANHGSTRTVNDAVDTDDSTIGGGDKVVNVYWDGSGEEWRVKIQGSLQSILERGAYPGFNLLTTDFPFIIAPNGDSDVRDVYDNFGGSNRYRLLTGGSLGTGTTLPSWRDLFLPLDSEVVGEHDADGSITELFRFTNDASGVLDDAALGMFRPGYDIWQNVTTTGALVYNDSNDRIQQLTGTTGQVPMFNTGAAPTAVTVVRSIFLPADSLYMQGCTLVTGSALVTSGLVEPYVTCGDDNAHGFHRSLVMPDGWDRGTITVQLTVVNVNAAPANDYEIDFSAECEPHGSAWATTISTTGEQPATIDFDDGGSCEAIEGNACDQFDTVAVTTAAITPNGTCTGTGVVLRVQGQVDATATTTAQVADVKIVGIKVEYTRSNVTD